MSSFDLNTRWETRGDVEPESFRVSITELTDKNLTTSARQILLLLERRAGGNGKPGQVNARVAKATVGELARYSGVNERNTKAAIAALVESPYVVKRDKALSVFVLAPQPGVTPGVKTYVKCPWWLPTHQGLEVWQRHAFLYITSCWRKDGNVDLSIERIHTACTMPGRSDSARKKTVRGFINSLADAGVMTLVKPETTFEPAIYSCDSNRLRGVSLALPVSDALPVSRRKDSVGRTTRGVSDALPVGVSDALPGECRTHYPETKTPETSFKNPETSPGSDLPATSYPGVGTNSTSNQKGSHKEAGHNPAGIRVAETEQLEEQPQEAPTLPTSANAPTPAAGNGLPCPVLAPVEAGRPGGPASVERPRTGKREPTLGECLALPAGKDPVGDLIGPWKPAVIEKIERDAGLSASRLGHVSLAVRLNIAFPRVTGVRPEDVAKVAARDCWELNDKCLATLLGVTDFPVLVKEAAQTRRLREKARDPEAAWRRACEYEACFTEFMLVPEVDPCYAPLSPDLALASLFLGRYGPEDCAIRRRGLVVGVTLPQGDRRVEALRPEWEEHRAVGTLPARPGCLVLEGVAA